MVLEQLDAQTLGVIKSRSQLRSFKKATQIFTHGEPGASMLIIENGRVEISITTVLGQKSILGLAGMGDVVGDIACLDGGPRSADVVAIEPVKAYEILRRDMLQILRENPDSAILVIEALCQKARNASEMFELKALSSGQSRLASCLLRLLSNEPGATRIRVSQSWLGAYAGLTRENVNRQIKAWDKDGIARFEKGEIVVEDLEALTELAQSDEYFSRR